jgi:hypothetical protein
VCADVTFGLRARIEGWSTRPKAQFKEERRRKKKIPLASHHHRKNLVFGFAVGVGITDSTFLSIIGGNGQSSLEKTARAT